MALAAGLFREGRPAEGVFARVRPDPVVGVLVGL